MANVNVCLAGQMLRNSL